MGRCPVLRVRDDYHRGLRRFQLRPAIHIPATVRRCVDVRRRERDRHPGRLPRRPAAVAPLRADGRPPPGTPHARPRRRRRTGVHRRPRRPRSQRCRIRRPRHRAGREQPLPADRGRTRCAGDLRGFDDAPDAGIGARRSRPRSGGGDPGRHGEHRDRDRLAGDPGIRHQGSDRHARPGPRVGHGGESAVRLRKRAVDRRPRGPLVHRRGDGFARARDVLGRAALLHGRRNAGGAG